MFDILRALSIDLTYRLVVPPIHLWISDRDSSKKVSKWIQYFHNNYSLFSQANKQINKESIPTENKKLIKMLQKKSGSHGINKRLGKIGQKLNPVNAISIKLFIPKHTDRFVTFCG